MPWPVAWRSIAWRMARSCATGIFDGIWIQPAAGDAGGALGAALAGVSSLQRSAANGRRGADLDARRLSWAGLRRKAKSNGGSMHAGAQLRCPGRGYIDRLHGARLGRAKGGGWFQGRMEFGPRALGSRSILGDPRSPAMQKTLKSESEISRKLPAFRAVSAARGRRRWFELDADSPYMLLVADVRERHRLPMTEEEQALFGIDKLNVARSRYSGGDPCRLFGARPDRAREHQSPFSRADLRASSS